MMDKPKKHPPIREIPPPPEVSPEESAGTAQGHEPLAKLPEQAPADDPMAALEQRCAELEAKYLRATADLQNMVRRSQQNVTDARQQQLMDVARAMVLVLDHFDHALDVDPANTSPDALMTGVRMVRDELLGALERFGVKRLEVKQGEQFDPHRHEALMRQAVDGLGPDRIAVQFKPGYTLEDRTLRPAQVSVTE